MNRTTMSKSGTICSALVLLMGLGLAQAGCSSEESVEKTADHQLLLAGGIQPADLVYMRKLTERSGGGAIKLDLSDEVQYRFLRARVAASGKTPEEYPQFFAMLQGMRDSDLARKNNPGFHALATAPSDHLVGDFVVLPGTTKTFEATTFSTIQDGSDYSFVDAVVWDETQTTQLSDYGWGEVYGDGRKLRARATGPFPADPKTIFQIDSVSLISVNGVEESYYTFGPGGAPGGVVDHPHDKSNDNIVTICLNRNFSDCDYSLVGELVVKMPLKGTVTFPFPVTAINNNKDTTYTKLVEQNGGSHEMAFGPFSNWLSINPAERHQVVWDVPQSAGQFTGVLFKSSEDVDFFQSIGVTLNRNGNPVKSTIKISSIKSQTSPGMPTVPKAQIVYSCLAKGTQIRLGNGTTAKIEDIKKETMVMASSALASSAGLTLGVSDTSIGIERIPMVHMEDGAGHSLLLTTSHPVVTPDRGVVWAEELSAGSEVITESGVTTLVKVRREMYDGSVHNLKLDTSDLADSAFSRGSAMYANGFLVGDLAMQRAYEFKNAEDRTVQVLSRLPAKWHTDYQSSQR